MTKKIIKIVGLAGVATSGKDLFYNIAKNVLLKEHGRSALRFAFADALKDDLQNFLLTKYNISAWTSDPEEKKIVRPIMVAHGCSKREQTGGKYWVDKTRNNIQKCIDDDSKYRPDFIFITDVRFPNECEFIQKEYDGKVIHIKKYIEKFTPILSSDMGGSDYSIKKVPVRVYTEYPNDEERKNDPQIEAVADYKLEWQNMSPHNIQPNLVDIINNAYLNGLVKNCLNSLFLLTKQ